MSHTTQIIRGKSFPELLCETSGDALYQVIAVSGSLFSTLCINYQFSDMPVSLNHSGIDCSQHCGSCLKKHLLYLPICIFR